LKSAYSVVNSRWETEALLRHAEAHLDYTTDDLERDIAVIHWPAACLFAASEQYWVLKPEDSGNSSRGRHVYSWDHHDMAASVQD
jgi:hypothetical protein